MVSTLDSSAIFNTGMRYVEFTYIIIIGLNLSIYQKYSSSYRICISS
jgi:hypothetical protein